MCSQLQVAAIKGAKLQGKDEVKLAAAAAKAAAKAKDKADARREDQKQKLYAMRHVIALLSAPPSTALSAVMSACRWEKRHAMLTKWREAVKKAKEKMK